MFKMKVDTGAQGYILPLRIYRSMFPEHIDDYGLPTGTTPTPTKLTAYNGTPIRQHGVCSIQCSYGDKETNAMFYVADVNGPAICGLPNSRELQLVELYCELRTKATCIGYIQIDLMVLANLKENTTLLQTQIYHL